MEHTRKEEHRKPRFVRWAVMVGIVVVLNIFFLVARSYVLEAPKYETYCPAPTATTTPRDAHACTVAGGIWNDLGTPSPKTLAVDPTQPTGYCDFTANCQPVYQAAFDQFQLYSFIIEVALGLLAIIVGVLPLGSSIVSTGLTYGGVLAFVIASGQYWTDADNLLRLAISVIALGALIYIGLRRFKD